MRPHKYKPVLRGSHKRAAQVAAKVLTETDNSAIGYGDSGLLHMVAEQLGWPPESWLTEKRVLDAIDRHHEGVLVKRYFQARRGHARVFYLPGHES
jgi:hypothetical protein